MVEIVKLKKPLPKILWERFSEEAFVQNLKFRYGAELLIFPNLGS